MTRKSLTDKLRERRAIETGQETPAPAPKRKAAPIPAPSPTAELAEKKKTPLPRVKKALSTPAGETPARDASLPPAPVKGELTTLSPEGPLAERIGKGRIGAVRLADGRVALVDRHWGGDISSFVWPVEYVFDLPVIGMTLCKLVYHRGDDAVYLKADDDGTRNLIPRITPATALGAVVGRLVGIVEPVA
ncbi:MAG: hypothetical protein HQK87_06260 [Nitrospinae bacterium]|nr:hypothetical protein [Nitrospinota bacterium]